MTLSLRASGQAPPIPSSTPKASRPLNVQATITDPPNFDLLNQALCYGTTTGSAPSVFGDLVAGVSIHLTSLQTMNLNRNATPPTITITENGIDITAQTVGNHLWVAYCAVSGAPSGGTALAASVDLGVLGA